MLAALALPLDPVAPIEEDCRPGNHQPKAEEELDHLILLLGSEDDGRLLHPLPSAGPRFAHPYRLRGGLRQGRQLHRQGEENGQDGSQGHKLDREDQRFLQAAFPFIAALAAFNSAIVPGAPPASGWAAFAFLW